jgi:hypothetical protein
MVAHGVRQWPKPCWRPPSRLPPAHAIQGIRTVEHSRSHRFLPTLLLQSISLFFIGGVLYSWQMNKIVMVIFAASGGPLFHRILPVVHLPLCDEAPSLPYAETFLLSTLLRHRKGRRLFRGRGFRRLLPQCPRRNRYNAFPFIQTVPGAGPSFVGRRANPGKLSREDKNMPSSGLPHQQPPVWYRYQPGRIKRRLYCGSPRCHSIHPSPRSWSQAWP